MLLTTFLLRNFLKITFACISLLACNLIDRTAKLFHQEIGWQDLTCDSTATATTLNVYALTQPFYLSDTLLKQKWIPEKVFVAMVGIDGNMKIAGVTASNEDRPTTLNLTFTPIAPPKTAEILSLTWQEQEYLWALATQPRYLYTRWEKLLAEDRNLFLAKRDSIKMVMNDNGNGVKIISDLRSIANQQKYLGSNKTTTPISMHNFGLAADFAIFRRGRISNNLSLYKPLDNLTKASGMTWGGNFVGFIDSGHIQLFKNGAELIRKYPALVYEFEPYRIQYNAWMSKMINWGKEEKAGDTKELLVELNKLKKDNVCACTLATAKTPSEIINTIKTVLSEPQYLAETDLLIIGDLASQTVSLVTPKGVITYPLGIWK
jgi:peptidoglycan L-alanyl-D-glutamate endopeptidase CwlK